MPDKVIRIAIAQINTCVGNIPANTDLIISKIQEALDKYKANIIVFPELTISSYPPEDLLLRPAFHKQISQAFELIQNKVIGIDCIIGYPEKTGNQLFNSCSLLRDRKLIATYRKQILPNYAVFDEKRYFNPGKEACVFDFMGIPTALSICEDIWEPGPCAQAKSAGAKLMININASPYHVDKISLREKLLRERVAESGLNIIYVNLVGGQDELIFDGGSLAIDHRGNVRFHAPQFQEGLYVIEFSSGDNGCFSLPMDIPVQSLSKEESIYQALVLGVKDYVYKNGFKGAIIGLSGGVDSALTLCIAVDALGRENVDVLIMPSRYTADMSIEDAKTITETLGVQSHIISIEKLFETFNESLKPLFSDMPKDITEENIQARCRGILLMAVSNKLGKLVLTTGNKSEMAVGYATLYGDMAGGFAPLKDITKTSVYKLAGWRNQISPVILQRIIDRPPSAELRENQFDQDTLPAYDILDPILERYIEFDQSPEEITKAGYDEKIVQKVVTMVDRNEYKRRQSAPGIRITQRAFGRDRRYPITSGYRE
ncbi:MAG: NAD+ synthase [Gammaproteobacteria bacterium]|nr:NAD+ synthase [Gammaproteobacteria bacterium]